MCGEQKALFQVVHWHISKFLDLIQSALTLNKLYIGWFSEKEFFMGSTFLPALRFEPVRLGWKRKLNLCAMPSPLVLVDD